MLQFFTFLLILSNIFYIDHALSFDTKARQVFLIDMETNEILIDKNSNDKMAPSSMSKLMTILLIFERLEKGEMLLSDKFTISEKAWKMQGSKTFVKVGEEITVEDLLKGIVVQSGNDACMVIAESFAGSEEEFCNIMNHKAKEIGLKDSHFANSTGLPNPEHYMTARDLAILAKYLITHYPSFYHYFKIKEFTYNNIKQENRNVLLFNPTLGVDGLKTGVTDLGGYGIVASAELNNRRLILVVNGLDSMSSRSDEAKRLLSYGFTNFVNIKLFNKGDIIENAKVWLGEQDHFPITAAQDIIVTVPKHQEKSIKVKLKYASPISTPINLKDLIAELEVFIGDNLITSFKIHAQHQVKKLPFFKAILKKFKYYVFHF